MKLLIDADGCPVTNIAVQAAKNKGLACLIFCDTAHELKSDYADILVFDKGKDSVDYAIIQRLEPGDVIVTQDYGLAALCLSRNCRILNQDGWEYTADNIDALLYQRYHASQMRKQGKHLHGNHKRTSQQDDRFLEALENILSL